METPSLQSNEDIFSEKVLDSDEESVVVDLADDSNDEEPETLAAQPISEEPKQTEQKIQSKEQEAIEIEKKIEIEIEEEINSKEEEIKNKEQDTIDRLEEEEKRKEEEADQEEADLIEEIHKEIEMNAKKSSVEELETRSSPVVQQYNPIEEQRSPIVQQRSPVEQQRSPIAQQHNPIEEQRSPIVQQRSPVEQQRSPIVQQCNSTTMDRCVPIVEQIQFHPVYRRTATRERGESQESEELEEISGNEFANKKVPDSKKMEQILEVGGVVFDAQGNAHTKRPNIGNLEMPNDFKPSKHDDEDVQEHIGRPKKTYQEVYKTWWKEEEPEVSINCIMVYNLAPSVDEEVLYELFCKVGKIKRMRLFRISNHEIESSYYLSNLNLRDPKARPHKKKAIIEYHAPNYADHAIEVFSGLKLYNRKIFVMKHREDHARFRITFLKPKNVNPWFDEFFCLDYFSNFTNLLRTSVKLEPGSLRINLFYNCFTEWETAKEIIKNDLRKYLDKGVQIGYYTSQTNPTRDERREQKSQMRSNGNRFPPSNYPMNNKEDAVLHLSDTESGEEKIMDLEE